MGPCVHVLTVINAKGKHLKFREVIVGFILKLTVYNNKKKNQ